MSHVETGAELSLQEQRLFTGEDAKEGIAAYIERRTPNFSGR